jgi:hypothetical protein
MSSLPAAKKETQLFLLPKGGKRVTETDRLCLRSQARRWWHLDLSPGSLALTTKSESVAGESPPAQGTTRSWTAKMKSWSSMTQAPGIWLQPLKAKRNEVHDGMPAGRTQEDVATEACPPHPPPCPGFRGGLVLHLRNRVSR